MQGNPLFAVVIPAKAGMTGCHPRNRTKLLAIVIKRSSVHPVKPRRKLPMPWGSARGCWPAPWPSLIALSDATRLSLPVAHGLSVTRHLVTLEVAAGRESFEVFRPCPVLGRRQTRKRERPKYKLVR
jgi:hypothetical protein